MKYHKSRNFEPRNSNREKILSEPRLPPKEFWIDTVFKKNKVSDEDIVYANKVFDLFKCKNISDYLDIYLAVDVLLLASLFESWRQLGVKHFSLDMANFISLPSKKK